MFSRVLSLPPAGEETFFLWGPRQTGKSTLLHQTYPDAFWIDLLDTRDFRQYLERPELLRERVEQGDIDFVVIDEVQKVPALLDEVHWLHENRGVRFALCGSSARKVRRGQANLLGGRAIRYELMGFVSRELGDNFDLVSILNRGTLPGIYTARRPARLLQSYVADYLKEEIAAEGLVRRLPSFSMFLNVAALSDTQLVNMANIARECGVARPTVKAYFEILEDTLLGRWLPAYRKRPKRRVIAAPKFYFTDVGVANSLGLRGELRPGSELFGKAFENWVHHELSAYRSYSERTWSLSYWRLASGLEVDFILGDMRVAIEVKASRKITTAHLKGIRTLRDDHPEVARRIVVCLETPSRRTPDGIEILSVEDFIDELWDHRLV